MSENSAAPGEPQQPEQPDAGVSTPQYGVRIPSATGVPPWHPEANAEQRAAGGVPPVPTAPWAQQPGWTAGPVPTAAPGENVVRGALFALLVVPMGILVWMMLWKFGVVASIVTFGVAILAARLYTHGSGGTLSRTGVWVALWTTTATFLLAFIGGLWLDTIDLLGGSALARMFDFEPWDVLLGNLLGNPEFINAVAKEFLIDLLFAALGCVFTFRRLFASTKEH